MGVAYDEAARFAELALHAAEADSASADGLRIELTLDAARAEFVAGHIEACLGHCQTAARLAEDTGRPDILAAAALVITGVGDPATTGAVEALCAKAIRAVPAEDSALRARLLARQAIAAAETGAGNRARELSAEALALAEHSDDPDALLDGIHARHLSLCAPQFLAERRELAARACQVAHQARQPLAELWGHVWLVDAAFQAEISPPWTTNSAASSSSRSTASTASRGGICTGCGRPGPRWSASWARRWSTTRPPARSRCEIGTLSTIGMYYAFLNELALLRGTIAPEAGRAAIAMLQQAPSIALVRIFIPLVHALRGDHDLARATFEEFRHMPGTIEVGPRWAALVLHIGFVALLLDDTDTAERVYQEVSGLAPGYMADGSGVVFCGGATERVGGDLALATGRVDEAIGRYTTAIEMNARIGARPFLALSRLGLAKALVAGRWPGPARRPRPGHGGRRGVPAARPARPAGRRRRPAHPHRRRGERGQPAVPPGIRGCVADRARDVQPADRRAARAVRTHRGNPRPQHPGQARLLHKDRDRYLVAAPRRFLAFSRAYR